MTTVILASMIIPLMLARQQAQGNVASEFGAGQQAGESAGKAAAESGQSYDAEAPSGHTMSWIAGYHYGYSSGYTTAKSYANIGK
jgi:hypothetical protein